MALSVNEASTPFETRVPLDTLAVLRASQTLCTERTAATLRARAHGVLSSMVGASRVMLAVWDDELGDWVLPGADENNMVAGRTLAQEVPMTVLREAQVAGQPMLVVNAFADERFRADPYFIGMDRCSLIALAMNQLGAVRAMLILESRNAPFAAAQMEAAAIVAAQLGLSLDNARLFERLEHLVSEQTRQLHAAEARLEAEERRAGTAQIATNVLHNVGNVLTSVNVSAHVLAKQVEHSPVQRVGDVAQLLTEQSSDFESFFGPNGRGRLLPGYLSDLAKALGNEREELLSELDRLRSSIDHIKNVISMQQSYATGRLLEPANLCDIVEDALGIQEASIQRHAVQVRRNYSPVEIAPLDRTRVMQILVNLLENARHAMNQVEGQRLLEVAVRQEPESLLVSIRDNGCGISPENIERIFSRGFTTKTDGHGFGLHSCSSAAREMGGSLAVHSEGAGKGATFELRLPLA